MSSEDKFSAERRIERVLCELDEGSLYRRIDEPIDRAVEMFTIQNRERQSIREFLNLLGTFVTQLHDALPWSRATLTPDQARAEGLGLLESGYTNGTSRGLYAAFLDALDPHFDGIAKVLDTVATAHKQAARARYVQWVLAQLVDPLDWNAKVELAGIILIQLRPYLIPPVRNASPSMLAHEISPLISLLHDSMTPPFASGIGSLF